IEMPDREGHVDVAAFPDRFAVVQRFEDGEEAGLFLHLSRDGIEDARARVSAEFGPFRLCLARGLYRRVDIALRGLGHMRQHLTVGGVARFKGVAGAGEFTVDEMSETAT